MSAHIGDSAALYALGTLNADEHADVETHVATCEACARLLAQACDDVTLMVETQTQHDVPLQLGTRTRGLFNPTRRTGNFRSVALAAAIAIALLPSAYLLHVNRTIEHRMDAEAGLPVDGQNAALCCQELGSGTGQSFQIRDTGLKRAGRGNSFPI